MGAVVARAPEDAQAAMERDVVARWRPYLTDRGTILAEQPTVIATGRKPSGPT